MADDCPHCGGGEIEIEADGAVKRCRACGRSALRATAEEGGAAPNDAPQLAAAFSTAARRAVTPGEVAVLPAAAIALVATLLVYGGLHLVPGTRAHELFLERGWVQYAITFVTAWALALLAAKRARLARERRMLARDWLARSGHSSSIRPADVDTTLAVLVDQRLFAAEAFLARRIVRALRHFQARRRVVEVVEFLSVESRADESRIDASYSLIRVFIWVVPTLGFIGTVIGIGAAVAGFSTTLESTSSIVGMRDSIEAVTMGLGVAFDTTLLGLVMTILVMFPSSALQRLEERFLGDVDDYCAEHLVRRLVEEPDDAESDVQLERLVDRLVAALQSRVTSRT